MLASIAAMLQREMRSSTWWLKPPVIRRQPLRRTGTGARFSRLRMYAHIQELNRRPHFELEASDHPLSREYRKGVSAERVKKIMMERLRGNE